MTTSATLNYHRVGSGPPLVLVHGIAASWQCWNPIIPALAQHHDVIAPDLPGFGGSLAQGIDQPSIQHFAQSVLDLLDSLGIEEFHVAGNSLGGAIAIELTKSGRVLSLTGISPAGQTQGPYLELTKALLRGSYWSTRLFKPALLQLIHLRPLRMAFLAQMVGKPQRLTRTHAAELITGCAVGIGFAKTLKHAIPLEEGLELPDYDGPAQLLWGTRDWILPLSATGRFAERWPDVPIIPLKGLGHVPMQDDPKQIVEHMLALTQGARVPTPAAA
jgi:pimeloyl-ACP methyl ester carboxylesterase